MATFVVCSRCSKTLEIAAINQFPDKWQSAGSAILCLRCANTGEVTSGEVLGEEMIFQHPNNTLAESVEEECEICRGPCQGH